MIVFCFFFGLVAALRAEDSFVRGGYSLSRLSNAKVSTQRPSELKVTQNVVRLRKAGDGAASLSSKIVRAMRLGTGAGALRRDGNGSSTPLQSVEGGHVFLADLVVGGQQFSAVIDTGSSDPWFAVSGFHCFDKFDHTAQDESYCQFGPTYRSSRSSTYKPVTDQNFNISYADGEYLTGRVGLENFTMAGINVPNQKFGLVDAAAWTGDGISSGLVGFAYRSLTSAYAGSNGASDVKGQTQPYNPLFVNMYTDEGVSPVFTLAIDRDENKGGIMALGGIPNVPHVPYFVSTPIRPRGVNKTDGTIVYEFYTINIGGYAIANSTDTQFNPYSNTNALKKPLMASGTNTIIDSGTSLIYVPDAVADAFGKAFKPPATWDMMSSAYFVDCSAIAPIFGVAIGDKVFYANAQDLVVQVTDTLCVSGVQPSLGGMSLLGATWMKSVLAVFDIGAQQMRFAARQFYPTIPAA